MAHRLPRGLFLSDKDSAAPEVHLCNLCRGINIEQLCRRRGYIHALSGYSLHGSARKCQLCALFLRFMGNWQNIGQVVLYVETDNNGPVFTSSARLVVRHFKSTAHRRKINGHFIHSFNLTTDNGILMLQLQSMCVS